MRVISTPTTNEKSALKLFFEKVDKFKLELTYFSSVATVMAAAYATSGSSIFSNIINEQTTGNPTISLSSAIMLMATVGYGLMKTISKASMSGGPSLEDIKSGKIDIEKAREDRWVKRELERFKEINDKLIKEEKPPYHIIYNQEEKLRKRYHEENIKDSLSEKFPVEYTLEYKIWKRHKEAEEIDKSIRSFAEETKSRWEKEQELKAEAFVDMKRDVEALLNIYKDMIKETDIEPRKGITTLSGEKLVKAVDFAREKASKNSDMALELYAELQKREIESKSVSDQISLNDR